jgi:hypothetical protein
MIRLVAAFLAWIGLRAAMTLVLSVDDPNLRLAQELGFGPAVMVGLSSFALRSSAKRSDTSFDRKQSGHYLSTGHALTFVRS